MSSLRRHLRLSVATWLVFQAVSLSVLVPLDCCAAHRPAARDKEPGCHETAAATQCPVPPGPARRARCIRVVTPAPAGESGDRCSMRGTCDGPMAALFALLSNYGVLARLVRDGAGSSHQFGRSPHTREPDRPPRVSRSSASARVNDSPFCSRHTCASSRRGRRFLVEVFREVFESSGSRELRARVRPCQSSLSNRLTTRASADA